MAMINVFGIGPGCPRFVLANLEELCQEVDLIIGSQRQLEIVEPQFEDKKVALPRLKELLKLINEALASQQKILLLASGDPMFYGIGTFILQHFDRKLVQIYPGISSVQYLFSRLGLTMNDCYLTSSHGRQPDFDRLARESCVGMVTDEGCGPYQIAQALLERQAVNKVMYIGENLSYPNEKMMKYKLQEVPNQKYEMNVVILKDER
ncbi:precorrin-6y C5,15-methyltransferase (decarboxylating) subunit CbiE [Facklamia sp. DSM 111018]|uniref:Precorrin-6y C5,15-methyltransferase (Decarboxylating) subunit CbiE n=1 Tax=Facklamia lactis TaxID=2749967 RepID=A0ABS0LNT6_9LACT|nr:precorrin-6y C5,15-methyltransferase (decarboxylating) subunit CbiE [Facklamia lactis]MBG9979497.1 precorrin-6y C5,15-methyltransferase (decarboxylating) subunit CbiE [Facklamia lactis]MBG9985833.1 precorrin-6y C5,15-methyltransferase (decarboxylating) subunit CbiE [Facklamia lactis]